MRLLRCSKSSWTASCFGLVRAGVFLVGRSGVLGFNSGLFTSGGLTGSCLDRASGLLTYLALSASSLSTALCFGAPAAIGVRR